MGKCINSPEVGSRVWTKGFFEHGHKKVSVPAATGGTVIGRWNEFMTMDNPLHRVKWDTGQESVHYFEELFCIGQCRSKVEFEATILAEAERVKQTIGPNGGKRGLQIFLRNGDWVDELYDLLPRLKEKGIPIEIEQLEKRPRRQRMK